MIDLLQNVLEIFLLVTFFCLLLHISKEKWQIQKTLDLIFPSSPSINKDPPYPSILPEFQQCSPPTF